MTKPNILFIMTDQQRWDAMSCSGDWVQTPHMDRIASEGIRFSNCVTTSPVCIPARASLATGLYPHNTGIWDNIEYDMAADTPTWMQAIRDAGYRTSLFGKTHLHRHSGDLRDREGLMHAYGLDDVDEIGGPRASARVLSYMTERWQKAGFWEAYKADYQERFSNKPHVVRPSALPLEEYADVYVGQQAKTYLEGYDRDQPWFCWVSFGGPHEPWDTPEPYASRYRPADMPRPIVSSHRGGEQRYAAEDIADMRADYAGNVSLIDDQIGEILAAVEQRGELGNTVILFTSDHGEMNGDHDRIYKSCFFNGAVRVPLLVRTPATTGTPRAGSVAESPVEMFDLGPTLVELAGGELSHQQFARSLAPALADPSYEIREYAISEINRKIMYMDRRWKLILNAEGLPDMLFDQTSDPDEQTNIVDVEGMKETVAAIRLKIQEHLVKTQVQR